MSQSHFTLGLDEKKVIAVSALPRSRLKLAATVSGRKVKFEPLK